MEPKRERGGVPAPLCVAIGLLGLLTGLLDGLWWWSVAGSPGDDNPVALLFALGTLSSTVPTAGLGLRPPWGAAAILWLLASTVVLVVFFAGVLAVFGLPG